MKYLTQRHSKIYLIILSLLFIPFVSCKKILGLDTKSQLQHTWKLTDLYSYHTTNWRGYTGTDIYSSLSECEKDNLFTFENNSGNGFWDCNRSSGNSIFFQYTIINDSALHLSFANTIPEYFTGSRFSTSYIEFEIYDIGGSTLQLTRFIEQTGGDADEVRYVFKRQ